MFTSQRISAHLWMWGIISIGVILAFWTIPSRRITLFSNEGIFGLAAVGLIIYLIYYISSIIYCYFRYSITGSSFQKLVTAGVYGRRVHPTCSVLAILSWTAFFMFPNTKVLAACVWITLAVFFWIKMEGTAFKKQKTVDMTDSDPE